MTVIEFARYSDRKNFHLVDGQLVERPGGAKASHISMQLAFALSDFESQLPPGFLVFGSLPYQCFPDHPESVRWARTNVLDTSGFTQADWEDEFVAKAPELAVEVESPWESMDDLVQIAEKWLAAGVKLLWIVDPDDQSVHAYEPGKRPIVYEAADELPGEPILPGFKVLVGDLFKLPVPPA